MTPPDPTALPSETPSRASLLERAAQDLDALTTRYDDCVRTLEEIEATVDALLDDRAARIVVVDGAWRIVAMSRGMVDTLRVGTPLLGQPVAQVLPNGWPNIETHATELSVRDGWRELKLPDGIGRLCLRRVSEDDRDGRFVVRFEPAAGDAC